ncbi:hypothetical protein G7076_07625 [Sphingomonas sp. HDW15A]|uniref:JAB domain-containing protein n=1 Tax=Sphingomonas sp. HDW15A TaxID=2714942 RepID=UPI00140A5B39|nr:JAB domain-containing protein [Sphingomonas sp. HDW15A]QIK97216.1 hypothetical protein G7076_07625 [Sphingomonas sp. HDW15A]
MEEAPSDASGHRARLRQRPFEGGGGALLDHELVEYLLTLAIPRRDTKARAKSLIARLGGTGPLLSANAVHNHPSGDPTPSQADIRLTRDLIDAGRRMNSAPHNYLIVGAQGRSSMKAMGLI